MKKKKGKKSKTPQIAKEQKPPGESTAENIKVKETVRIEADSENPAPPEVHFDESDPEKNSGGENYDKKLRELMDPWRFLASEGRKEGHKSLSELLRELDRSGDADEGTRLALDTVKSTMISLVIRLSSLIIEYFSIFWRYKSKEILAKTRATANTIRHESLGGGENPSPITKRFVAVVELIDRQTKFPRHYNDRDEDDSDLEEEEDHLLWVNSRENGILGTIFYRVLFLEILFCFPFFSGGATVPEKKDLAAKIGEFVANESGFEAKLRSLESEIRVMKVEELEHNLAWNEGLGYAGEDPKTKRKKAILGFEIKEMWKGLVMFS